MDVENRKRKVVFFIFCKCLCVCQLNYNPGSTGFLCVLECEVCIAELLGSDLQGHVKKLWSWSWCKPPHIHLIHCVNAVSLITPFKFKLPACSCLRGNCQYSVEMRTTLLRSEKGSVASTEPKKTTKLASRVSACPCHFSCLLLKLRFCKCAQGGAHTTKKANWLYSQSGWTTH